MQMASGCCFGGVVAFVNLHNLDAFPASAPSAVHRGPTLRSPKRDLKLFPRSEGDASFIQKWRTHMYGSPHLLPRAALNSTRQTGKEKVKNKEDERVQQVHTIQEFEEALRLAKNKLVVVEYAASHSYHSRKIYPFMVELSRTCPDVIFLLVMGDESDETKELCARENIETVPHFSFYKSMEKIHEEEGIAPDQLEGDVLYYGDPDAPIHQLHSRRDVEALLKKHAEDNKLVVLDVGLKHCGPCVKVYPTVVKLSRKMADTVVFARMNGDENEECMEFLREMDVVEVPTFLFIKHGKIYGRYVGSGKGELIGEILRYQGVKVA